MSDSRVDKLSAYWLATRRWFYIDAKDHAAAVPSFLAGRK